MSKTVIGSKIGVRGDLAIIRRDALTGVPLDFWQKKNVITFSGTEALIRLMAPNTALGANVQQENQIRSMRFGTNGTLPQRTDVNLLNEAVVNALAVRKELGDAQRVIGASGTVEFVATLASTDGNGLTYREAGLFTRGTTDDPKTTHGAVMFSRQVFPDQPKTASVELEFRWRITFTV